MRALELLQEKIDSLRFRGFGGTPIKLHRAIYQLELHKGDLLIALLLPLLFNFLLFHFLDEIIHGWHAIFSFWLGKLEPGSAVSERTVDLGNYLLWLPFPDLSAGGPSSLLWWGTLIVCILLFIATYFIPTTRLLPLVYMMRAGLLVQSTALAFFAFIPGEFPYDLQSYVMSNLVMSLFFLFMIPWIFGVTYYVFDFPLLQKVAITTITLLYFLIALPMQYLMHAFVLHYASLLFLPILYLLFGVFLDVMMFVALYSWGMSLRWTKLDNGNS